MNNPLIYTDPSGEKFTFWHFAAGAFFGAASWSGIIKHAQGKATVGQAVGEYFVNVATFVVGGAISTGVGGLDGVIMSGMVTNGLNDAGMAAIYGGNIDDIIWSAVKGAITGGFSAAAGHGAFQAMNNLINKTFTTEIGRLTLKTQPFKLLPENTLSYMAGSTASQMTANLVNGRNPFKGVDYGFNPGLFFSVSNRCS